MIEGIDPTKFKDEEAREIIILLLNMVEKFRAQIRAFQEETQRLRDEINRLKGEQGKPQIRPQSKPVPQNISSEKERYTPKTREHKNKQEHLEIAREEICRVDRAALPADAQFKGYEEVIVQDLRIESANVRFRKEKYYSPSEGRTILAPLPQGYDGQFGPDLRSFILSTYFASNVSEAKLHQMLTFFGISISMGQLSNILITSGAKEGFDAESSAVLAAGLESSFYQQIDETSTRVDGQNYSCQIITTPSYTAYRTVSGKDRLSVIRALTDGQPLSYLLNEHVLAYLEKQGLAHKWLGQLKSWPTEIFFGEDYLEALLKEWAGLPVKQAKLIREGLALGAYEVQQLYKPVFVLIGDDAPQWRELSAEIGLCWIHAVRHYKKLNPEVEYLGKVLNRFMGRIWCFYDELKAFKLAPDPQTAEELRKKFRRLFSTVTDYDDLNELIARTKQKQTELLLVLKYPQIPLHNNASELGARQRVRKRDVSFGPRSQTGLKAWDTFMTLAETTRKLGVNFHAYLRDRIMRSAQIPPLAGLVKQKAADLNLAIT